MLERPPARFTILYEDKDILVVDKPSGYLVLPDRYDASLPNLVRVLSVRRGKVFVVHRIDKETSGLVLFAKHEVSHAALSQQFEHRLVQKRYYAITVGALPSDEDVIDAPLVQSDRDEGLMKVDVKRGKEARTRYQATEVFKGYSFVELHPETGRTHQIRVHLQHAGSPILADPLYGDGKPFYLSGVKTHYKGLEEERPLLARTALHAVALSFVHPGTRERVQFGAELPRDMEAVLKNLRRFCRVVSFASNGK
ncbi:MAG: RluA family pseudouridine synthase [Ignavibacteriales bacterium]|nr:RluA family pseudouridine synthase [Ignavibacteriales bacterium]